MIGQEVNIMSYLSTYDNSKLTVPSIVEFIYAYMVNKNKLKCELCGGFSGFLPRNHSFSRQASL